MVDFEESVFRVTAFSSPLLCLRWAWVRTSTNNVAAVLTPARGKRPTASAWAIEAHDVGPGGAMTERLLRASGAIATAATHTRRARPRDIGQEPHLAGRHAGGGWQSTALYAEQLRRRGKRVTISIPNATPARDLRPPGGLRGVLDIRVRRDFGRFDPPPGEAPHFSKSGLPVERRPFCEVKTFLWIAATWHAL